jgi:solute carrier family 35 protein
VLTGEAPLIGPRLSSALAELGILSILILFTIFSLFGMLLNWSMFLCTISNSALTTTIVGVLKVHYLPAADIFSSALQDPVNIFSKWTASWPHHKPSPCVFVGQGAVATLLGFFLLGGVRFHPLNVTGIIINTIGGTW